MEGIKKETMKKEDTIKNVRLIYFRDHKRSKQITVKKVGRRIANLLASIDWDKFSSVEIMVRYGVGENAMTLLSDSDARWALQCFIREYQD